MPQSNYLTKLPSFMIFISLKFQVDLLFMLKFFIDLIGLLLICGYVALIKSEEFDIAANLINYNLLYYFDEVIVLI